MLLPVVVGAVTPISSPKGRKSLLDETFPFLSVTIRGFLYDAAGKLVAEYSTIVETGLNAKVGYLTNDHLVKIVVSPVEGTTFLTRLPSAS